MEEELWYPSPAQSWNEALPAGNGRLGAMVFGGVSSERIQLNEDSVWHGGPMDRINPSAKGNLEKVRTLIREKRIEDAEELLKLSFSGIPQGMRRYQTLCDLLMTFPKGGEATGYRRSLSLSDALLKVSYERDGVSYERELFSSYPDQVIVLTLKADKPALSFTCRLDRGGFSDSAGAYGSDGIFLKGNGGEGGVRFIAALRADVKGGSVEVIGETLCIRNALEAVLYIGAETTFYNNERYEEKLEERLERAMGMGHDELLRHHRADYSRLYSKLSLSLSHEPSALSTDKRLLSPDLGLVELYFNFGRYLLISSSRPGTLPANLQGIWNESMEPKWDSKFTININTEMNYWPSEACGLGECQLPLFDHLKRMLENGRRTAREMYGMRGAVAHHNTDIWGDSAPQDIWLPGSYWVLGGAFLCTHVWTHYIYTEDKAFLSSMFPVLEEYVLFLEDYAIEEDGCFVLSPSVSPENTYILKDGREGSVCSGAAMDGEIMRDLFSGYLKASEVLGIENETTEKARAMLPRFTPIRIGKHGQIMEWAEDWDEKEPGHRHMSHLYALYPGSEITPEHTPELARAAEVTLERRLESGGAYTGWSCAWLICLYAALNKGEEAGKAVMKLLQNSTAPNLFDTHPIASPPGYVFQIDGNLGAAAGIMRMLVKTDGDTIVLLPALPGSWEKGEVRGARLPRSVSVSFHWDGIWVYLDELEAKPGIYRVRYGTESVEVGSGGKARFPQRAQESTSGRPSSVIVSLE